MIPNTKKFHYLRIDFHEGQLRKTKCLVFCHNRAEFIARLSEFNAMGKGVKRYQAL